jgi:hypothetical protein
MISLLEERVVPPVPLTVWSVCAAVQNTPVARA